MIKQTASGEYYVVGVPSETFKTYDGAACHEITLRRAGNHSRPDTRTALQRMADDAFKVPMAEKPDRLAHIEAQLKTPQHQKAFDPSLSRDERLRHSIKLSRNIDAEAEEAAATRAEWLQMPFVAGATKEVARMLAAAEDDFNRDRGELVSIQHLAECLNTPGADMGHIKSEMKRLLTIESKRIDASRKSAAADLAAAQSRVEQLAASQRVAVKVPTEGESLLERGNSYTANLLAAGASHDQIDAAFAAMDAAFAGDTSLLAATLSANEEAA